MMRFLWCRLESDTHANATVQDIFQYFDKSVDLLLTVVVRAQMTFGWHWRRVSFAVLHSKLLQAVFEVFLLRYEDAVALLSYLKTKEELQLSHHGHLILLLHHISKLFTVLQARGACLRPYSALLSLYTMPGCFGSSKPSGCATYTSSSILPLRKALFTSI